MQHLLEIDLNVFFKNARQASGSLSDKAIRRIADETFESITKQFGTNSHRPFTIRMSNMGKPTCKLWYDANKPEVAMPTEPTFIMRMLIGDLLELVFINILREVGANIEIPDSVSLVLSTGRKVNGTPDIIIDGEVFDIKSCSNWAFNNKWLDFDTLKKDDPFGYVGQLAGYSKAGGWPAGGWWVINKETGQIRCVTAEGLDVDAEIDKVARNIQEHEKGVFKRQFEPVKETYRKKESGNLKLCATCDWCEYRKDCWPTLREIPSLVSTAKTPALVPYVKWGEDDQRNQRSEDTD